MFLREFLWFTILRAPDDGAGGGDGGGSGGGEGGDAGGGEGGKPAGDPPAGGAGDPPAPYRPEGLSDDLFGETDTATIDNLHNRVNGLRQELGARGQVPKEPGDYKFELSEKAAPFVEMGNDDPTMGTIRELAQQHGLTDKQFQFFPDLVDKMVDAGVIERPVDPDAIMSELAPSDFKGTAEEMKAEGAKRMTAAQLWIDTFDDKAGFDQPMRDELAMLTTTPAGVQVLEKFMKSGIQESVLPGGDGKGGVTATDIDARIADPRNDFNDPKYDEAFAKETREMGKRLHGN